MTPKQESLLSILLITAMLILTVWVGYVLFDDQNNPGEIQRLKTWFAQRDANCTCCLAENNYTVALHDYNNMTPYILKKCPDCQVVTLT